MSGAQAVITVPVTVPYVRYSTHGAHWFVARALEGLLAGSKLSKADIDGLCLSSFTLAPDTAVGVTQHLGLSLRWRRGRGLRGRRYQPGGHVSDDVG
jgi:hypothetical protein